MSKGDDAFVKANMQKATLPLKLYQLTEKYWIYSTNFYACLQMQALNFVCDA